jgi:hypothetical protein
VTGLKLLCFAGVIGALVAPASNIIPLLGISVVAGLIYQLRNAS